MAQTLADELHEAFLREKSRKRTLTWREIATKADVPYSWLRQATNGISKKPDAARLRRLGPVLGIPAERLLALTDQLGVAAEKVPDVSGQADLAAILAEMRLHTQAVTRQAEATEGLLTLLAARTPEVLDALSVLRALVRQAQEGDAPRVPKDVALAGAGPR